MATLDPFSARIVQLVRKMTDQEILALVRNQLGAIPVAEAAAAPAPKRRRPKKKTTRRKVRAKAKVTAKAAPKRTAKRAVKKVKTRGTKKRISAARQKVLDAVEKVVKANKGLSASEVARATNIGQVRVATALRELKLASRIYQGGDRRFARYAGDSKTAEAASLHARQNAGGPKVSRRTKARRGRRAKR